MQRTLGKKKICQRIETVSGSIRSKFLCKVGIDGKGTIRCAGKSNVGEDRENEQMTAINQEDEKIKWIHCLTGREAESRSRKEN